MKIDWVNVGSLEDIYKYSANAEVDADYRKKAEEAFHDLLNNIVTGNMVLIEKPHSMLKVNNTLAYIRQTGLTVHILVCDELNPYGNHDPVHRRIKLYVVDSSLVTQQYYDKHSNEVILDAVKRNKNLFIHEYIHYLDSFRNTESKSLMQDKKDQNMYDYFNSGKELNAYFQATMTDLLANGFDQYKDNFDKFSNDFGMYFNYILDAFDIGLTHENLNKLYTRVYKTWEYYNNEN